MYFSLKLSTWSFDNERLKMNKETESDGGTLSFMDMVKGYEMRSKLSSITNTLKLYEKISTIFLICKTPQQGLEIMKSILQEPDRTAQNNLFYEWMKKQDFFLKPNWQEMLAEILTILQNYRAAKVLGRSKDELTTKFVPKNNFKSFNISSIRKTLYNICENLTKDQTSKLVNLIENSVIVDFSLECYLLDWSEQKRINLLEDETKIDLSILVDSLKSLGCDNMAVDLDSVVEKSKCSWIKSKLREDRHTLDFYQNIDYSNIGLCVIISEANFSKGILPKRWGNEKDVQRLIEIFTTFNFKIETHYDLTHEQLVSTLSYYAKTVDESISYFVLIILSHGSENLIYTSDLVPVEMDGIEMVFQAETCPKLISKPKIFIIQSCQGEKWQKVVVKSGESEISSDNFVPKTHEVETIGPQRGDSMIAWSTVKGFASFRNKYNGSWYIEELCNELWKFGDVLDLVEILTRVNNNLRHKLYDGQFMVPSLWLCLRAKVKFPQLKENYIKGKKFMLERLIFEKYFKEFLRNKKTLDLCKFVKIR